MRSIKSVIKQITKGFRVDHNRHFYPDDFDTKIFDPEVVWLDEKAYRVLPTKCCTRPCAFVRRIK